MTHSAVVNVEGVELVGVLGEVLPVRPFVARLVLIEMAEGIDGVVHRVKHLRLVPADGRPNATPGPEQPVPGGRHGNQRLYRIDQKISSQSKQKLAIAAALIQSQIIFGNSNI